MKKNKKKGFTLVELLAVIVILAIILVIAVPQIMSTIKDTTKASLESSAKMVAAQVEKQYTVAQTLGKEFGDTGSCMQDWAGLNKTDYASCTYEITSNGTAKITLIGKGKFKNLSVCSGTRSSASATEGNECPLICKANEVAIDVINYEINYDSCMSYLRPIVVEDWGEPEGFLNQVCKNAVLDGYTFENLIYDILGGEYFTKEELISNNVVSSNSVWEPNITVGNYDSCVSYMKPKVVDEWGNTEEELESLCRGDITWDWTFSQNIQDMINFGEFTKEELLKNNVIGSDSVFIDIKPGNQTICVNKLKDEWNGTEEELQTVCRGEDLIFARGIDVIEDIVDEGDATEEELVENNVIKTVASKSCVKKGSLVSIATKSTELGITKVDECATKGTCEPGTPFAIKVSDTETYKFYVISDNGNEVTLIMNKSLGDAVEWISQEDYDKANADDNTECNTVCSDEGPITALNELNERTKDWNNLDSFSYTLINDSYFNANDYEPMNILNVKARMITYDELSEAWGEYIYEDDDTDWWWTSTASSGSSALIYVVRGIDIDNVTYGDMPTLGNKYGLRPVIQVKK